MHAFTLLGMAGAALAIPTNIARNLPYDAFYILMQVGSGDTAKNMTISLGCKENGTFGNLIGEDAELTPGVPAYLTGSDPYRMALNFDVQGTQYGAAVANIGATVGLVEAVTAVAGYTEQRFESIDGQILHRIASGSNMWLACNKDIEGETKLALSWGSSNSDGSQPEQGSCLPVTLYQSLPIFAATGGK